MESHEVTSRVPVDSKIGEQMVVFRSSRGRRLHDHVKDGQRVEIVRSGQKKHQLAAGRAIGNTRICAFKSIHADDIRDGYYAGARTRPKLLACLNEMYPEAGYYPDTPTAVIRVLREE